MISIIHINLKIKRKILNQLVLILGAGLKQSNWNELTTYASKVFWNMNKKNHNNDKVAYMIGQMASFKCKENYYSAEYSSSYVKPQT